MPDLKTRLPRRTLADYVPVLIVALLTVILILVLQLFAFRIGVIAGQARCLVDQVDSLAGQAERARRQLREFLEEARITGLPRATDGAGR